MTGTELASPELLEGKPLEAVRQALTPYLALTQRCVGTQLETEGVCSAMPHQGPPGKEPEHILYMRQDQVEEILEEFRTLRGTLLGSLTTPGVLTMLDRTQRQLETLQHTVERIEQDGTTSSTIALNKLSDRMAYSEQARDEIYLRIEQLERDIADREREGLRSSRDWIKWAITTGVSLAFGLAGLLFGLLKK